MADGLVSMSSQFQGLPMGDLIGGPLTAACNAQIMLAKATSDFINTVGFDPVEEGKKGAVPTARMVDFQFTRPEEIVDKNGDVQVTPTEYDLKVPLLAIVPVPTLQIDEVDVTFDMQVKSSTSSVSQEDSKASLSGKGSAGWGPFKVSVTVSGSVSSHKENTRASDNSAKYHVEVHAAQLGTPEGLSRVFDILNEVIVPTPSTPKKGGGGNDGD